MVLMHLPSTSPLFHQVRQFSTSGIVGSTELSNIVRIALGIVIPRVKETGGRKTQQKSVHSQEGKERYYCRWSVDIKSFEYTGFKQQ